MKTIKYFFNIVSLIAFSAPIILCACAKEFTKEVLGWNPWPLSLSASQHEMDERYISTDANSVNYFAAPNYSDWTSSTEAQYDMSIVPYNTSQNWYIAPFENTEYIDDENTPRVDCLSGGGQGQVVWQDDRGQTTMNCSWSFTDIATGKTLVPGQNSDYTLLVQYVDVSVDPVIDNHDTHVINYLRIKLNRNKITDSNALGFGNYGYWFNRPIAFNYHYDWTGSIETHESPYRETNLLYKFSVHQNVIQDELLGNFNNVNMSNWTINGTQATSYKIADSKNPNADDTYTQTLLIPTRITVFSDNFANDSNTLKALRRLTEIHRTDGVKYTIGANDFVDKPIEVLEIPNCTSIGSSAFQMSNKTSGCLYSVLCPELLQIGSSAFYQQTKLTYFLGAKVTTLGSNSFAQCTNLTSIKISELTTFPTDGSVFSGSGLQQITIGAPNNTPLHYNDLLKGTPILTSNVGVSNFNILIPAANAETDSTKSGWATSYYNPTFGWKGTMTASGHDLSYFFTPYN